MRGPWLLALCLAACDGSGVDPTDLKGVFEERAPAASGSALPSLSKPAPAASEESLPRSPRRAPIAKACLEPRGAPARRDRRVGKRPACKRSNVLEHSDAEKTPRYGCVFEPRDIDQRSPLPLVIFFHGEHDDPTSVHKKTRLRARYHQMDLSGDPKHEGFVILAPQARRIGQRLAWDTEYTARDNLDVVATDRFVDELVAEGKVDRRQIYAVGESRGGVMAGLYAMLRPDRVAAWGAYGADASELEWSCSEPPPPAAIVYRACDAVVPCQQVEKWIDRRDRAGLPTFSLRLGVDREKEPSCVLSKAMCKQKQGTINHNRWPAKREQELLEYLSRYSLDVER